MWFFCFPSHYQNERKVRDMASYDIKTVILDNRVEGSFPKSLAKQMFLTRLVSPRTNLWTGLEVSYVFFKEILWSVEPQKTLDL